MGRYSTDLAGPPPQPAGSQPGVNGMVPQVAQQAWPTTFNKPVIGLDLNGLIIEDKLLTGPDAVQVLPGVLDAVRLIRLKGYKLVILSDQPDISKNKTTSQNIDAAFQQLMSIFGKAGIFSIDGFLYNTSDMKEDDFAKPNLGMVKRAENEIMRGAARFKDGWYVGDSMVDLKFADKMGAKPVLIKTGKYQEAIDQLEKFTYKDLKAKTKIYNSLLEFANTLP